MSEYIDVSCQELDRKCAALQNKILDDWKHLSKKEKVAAAKILSKSQHIKEFTKTALKEFEEKLKQALYNEN